MKNYFEIFEIEEKIDIDLDDLEQKYLDFQRKFHPDKADISAIEKSIAINEGFDILQDFFLRASHILLLQGIDILNDSKSPKPDFATLGEIMEIQEELEIIDESGKKKIVDEVKKKLDLLQKEIAQKIDKKEFENAAQDLIKMKYLSKIAK